MCQVEDIIKILKELNERQKKTLKKIKSKDLKEAKEEIKKFGQEREGLIDSIVKITISAPENTFEYQNLRKRIHRILTPIETFFN